MLGIRLGTLTLKKPARTVAPIENQPLTSLFGKFAVMRQSINTKNMRFTCSHDTYDAAKAESLRLAIKFPDRKFLILEVVGSTEV